MDGARHKYALLHCRNTSIKSSTCRGPIFGRGNPLCILVGHLDVRSPLLVLLLSNAINLALDFCLIFAGGLGSKGAALATTVAEWVGAFFMLSLVGGQGRYGRPPFRPCVPGAPSHMLVSSSQYQS